MAVINIKLLNYRQKLINLPPFVSAVARFNSISIPFTIASGSGVGFWAANKLAKAGCGPAREGAADVGIPAKSDIVVGKPAGAPGWPPSNPGGNPAGPPGAN